MPYNDLLKGRYNIQGQIYHLTCSTYRRLPFLESLLNARILVKSFRYHHDAKCVDSLAYVVMPDHFHWLISLENGSISSLMNSVKSFSTKEINRVQGRKGKIWQKGFYDRAIRKEEDLVGVARYIVANPMRANLVKTLKDYPHWDAKWL